MENKDCIFCQIAHKTTDTSFCYEDDQLLAFDDIIPKAPIHILIIPKKHIATLNDINETNTLLAGKMMHTAQKIANQLGIAEAGYRVVMNCNKQGGQKVFHIHLHLLGGKHLTWPTL